jgi:hypothetical protein
MEHCTSKPGDEKEIPAFGADSIEMAMRLRIRDTIEELVKQELDAALGAVKSARVGDTRQGYRHGTREWTLTTSLGRQRSPCRGRACVAPMRRGPSGAARRCADISAAPRASMKRSWACTSPAAIRDGSRRVGAAAAGRTPVERCGIAAGRPLARGL